MFNKQYKCVCRGLRLIVTVKLSSCCDFLALQTTSAPDDVFLFLAGHVPFPFSLHVTTEQSEIDMLLFYTSQ